jgi:uncharacterized protein
MGTGAIPIKPLDPRDPASQANLLALNNLHEEQTSHLDAAAWQQMVGQAFAATVAADHAGFLIAFDQAAAYDSVNFLWLRARLACFVYVDRIVVAQEHRKHGIGRLLYEDLFARATAAGHDRVVCEVNFVPPNPVSDAFHARLGFAEIGRAELYGGPKMVRYLERRL